MRKSIKISLIIFLTPVVVVMAAIAIIPMIFDPNNYKFELTEAVRKSTGRILNIEGDLKLQILPKLAITAGKVSMNNPEGFDRQVFAEFDDAFFRIRLVPLLSRKIDIKKMVVNGLKVHLIRSKDGRMNWKGFRASPRATDKRTIPLHLENLSAGRAVLANSPLAMLFAMKLDIFGAEVTYADEMTGINIKVEDLEFIIDRFGLGREIDFKIQGNLTNSKPVFHESALIGGRIYVNEELNNIKVNDFKWTSKLDSEFLSDYFKQAELTATAEIDLAKNTFSTTGLRLTSGQTSLGANLFATRIFEKPNLDGQVSIERAHPARILELMGLQYIGKDPSTFSSLSGNFGLALNQSRLLLKDITLVLDGNPLRGVASLAGLESPEIKFNLSAERLEADRYLTESGALPIHFKSRVPSEAPSTEGEARPKIDYGPSARFNGTRVEGVLYFESLRFWGMLAEGVQIALDYSNQAVRSNQRFKKFYGGRLKGSVEFNNRTSEATLALNQNLSGVKIGPMLKDLNGRQPIDGSLDASIRLTGHGAQVKDLKSSLKGEIDATLVDGQLYVVDIEKVINQSKGVIPETGFDAESVAGRTQFSKLTYEAKVSEGVLDNRRVEAQSKHFDFTGSGKIDLSDERVDYRIDAVIQADTDPISGTHIQELKGLRIPIQIGGTLSAPTFRAEFKDVLIDPKIKTAVNKLKEKPG